MKKYLPWDEIEIFSGYISVREILNLANQGKLEFSDCENWSYSQQARFIESILIGIPTPKLYFCDTEDTFRIIDGNQRIYALVNFFINESLTLDNLEYRDDLDGLTASEIHKVDKRCILGTYLDKCTVTKNTPEEIVNNIWERLKRRY